MTRFTARLVAVLSTITTLPCARTGIARAQDRPDPSPPRHVSGLPATVPLLMSGNPPAQLPVVDVYLDGKGPFRFGIETGANFLTIRPQLGDSLGLARAGGDARAPEYLLDTLRIGAVRMAGVRLVSLRTASRDIDGVLGLPTFANVLLTVDYPGHQVRLEEGALPAPNGRDILPLTRTSEFWSLPISLGGRTFQGVIDTRSTGAFGITPSVAPSLTFDGEPVVVGRAVGAAIAETEVKSGRLQGDAVIGQYHFPSPDVGIRALPPGFPEEPLVGTIVWQQFVLTLDQRHARVRLTHAGGSTIVLPKRGVRASSASPASSSMTDAQLEALAGVYGDRTVTFNAHRLYLQRPGGSLLALVPVSMDHFTLQEIPAARFEFTRDATGRGVRLRVLNREGQWETVDRSK